MKNFNNLYKSYLKSIIKESKYGDDFEDSIAEDSRKEALKVKELSKEYVGKTIKKTKMIYDPEKGFEDLSEVKEISKIFYTFSNLYGKASWGYYYVIECGSSYNPIYFESFNELKKFIESLSKKPELEIKRASLDYKDKKMEIEAKDWAFEENAPTEEDVKNEIEQG